MKKVLFLAYNFPPIGGPGVPRNVSFVKYLPQFGYEPVVIAPESSSYYYKDESYSKQIPENTQIIRTKIFETLVFLKKLYFKIVSKLKKEKNQTAETEITNYYSTQIKGGSVFTSLKKTFRDAAFFPDDKNGWIYYAVQAALNKIKAGKIDVLHTTSFPYSAHIAGLIIKTLHPEIKWVADFRDAWHGLKSDYEKNAIVRALEYYLESMVLKKADAALTVSEPLREDFINAHKDITGLDRKFYTLTNGFDISENSDETANIPDELYSSLFPENAMSITYTGYFYRGITDTLHLLLDALDGLIEKGLVDRKKIRINVIGQKSEYFDDCVKRYDCLNYCMAFSHLTHDQIESIQKRSDLLLLLTRPGVRGIYTSKIFEYMGAKKPIFAICDISDVAAKAIGLTGTGVAIETWNKSRIQKEFMEFYKKFISGEAIKTDRNEAEISKFTRKGLTEKLAVIYYGLTASGRNIS